MKKISLNKLALLGIASGIVIAQTQVSAAQNSWYGNQNYTALSSDDAENSPRLTQSELEQRLNPETRKIFQGLSQEGKDLALKLANQSCKGQNTCKGLNSCKTDENSCAGQGGCKGQSKGPFNDKNKAVLVAAKHMMEKRLKGMANS